MTASFNGFEIKLTIKEARTGSHQGRCDDDVAYLLTVPRIRRQLDKIDPAEIRAELKEWGAWDDDELDDVDENRARILWIACGNIIDERATRSR